MADDRYKWVALANTTASMFMATLDGSIVIIALPAIFRGIHLDPLAPGNISYLLWMIMGYRLVQAVLVVTWPAPRSGPAAIRAAPASGFLSRHSSPTWRRTSFR